VENGEECDGTVKEHTCQSLHMDLPCVGMFVMY